MNGCGTATMSGAAVQRYQRNGESRGFAQCAQRCCSDGVYFPDPWLYTPCIAIRDINPPKLYFLFTYQHPTLPDFQVAQLRVINHIPYITLYTVLTAVQRLILHSKRSVGYVV